MINLIKKLFKKIMKKEFIIEINNVEPNQTYLYDDEFTYVLHLYELYKMTQNIPGHIVEVGVGHGRNAIIFGQLIKHYGEKNTKKYHGIDRFDGYNILDLKKEKHLKPDAWKDIDISAVNSKIASLGLNDICKLYQIDAYDIEEQFLNTGGYQFQPNSLLIALLYIDCNSYGAAKHSIEKFIPYMSKNSIIAVDEKNLGGETKALIDIAKEYNLTVEKNKFPSIYTFIKIT